MIGIINNYDKRIEILSKLLDCKLINSKNDLYDLDTLIFPISKINSEYIENSNISISDIFEKCYKLKQIFYYGITDEYKDKFKEGKIKLICSNNDEFLIINSKITIYGFLKYFLNNEEELINKNILILGYGNLGKRLAMALRGIGLNYQVYAPREYKDLCINNEIIAKDNNKFDIIINTIPFHIIKEEDYEVLKSVHIYDLASYPYGFDNEKIKVINLLKIPGKYYPYDAAYSIYLSIKKALLWFNIYENFLIM